MKYFIFLLTLIPTLSAVQTPLQKYKLILSAQAGEEVIKQKLFSAILDDLSRNQNKHIETLRSWDEGRVLEHYGKRVTDPNTSLTEKQQDPELVRNRLIQGVHKRSKEIARKIWAMMDQKSLKDIRGDLSKTLKIEEKHRIEAEKTDTESKKKAQLEDVPASPYYPGYYQGYYGNYAYNYLHNYGNYANPYPYYYTNHYYQPTLDNTGSYLYNFGYYPNYYYNQYYYPRYNRANGILATGIFGLAAIGSFVDWLVE